MLMRMEYENEDDTKKLILTLKTAMLASHRVITGLYSAHPVHLLCRFPRNALCICLTSERGRGRGSSYYGVNGLYTRGRTIREHITFKGAAGLIHFLQEREWEKHRREKNESCKAKIQLRPHKSLSSQR